MKKWYTLGWYDATEKKGGCYMPPLQSGNSGLGAYNAGFTAGRKALRRLESDAERYKLDNTPAQELR